MDAKGIPNTASCGIGLDVGGSKIAGAIVMLPAGHVFARTIIPTQAERGGEAVLAASLELAAGLKRQAQAAGLSTAVLGVCVCELVNLQGNVTSDKTIAWRGIDLRERFSPILPTFIESDVRAAARAEGAFGAGRGMNLFVYVTVGTGISYALVQAGKPYAGAHGNAILIGNSALNLEGESGRLSETTLEQISSGPALVSRYNRATSKALARAEEVTAAAQAGDGTAAHIVRQGGEALGMGIGLLVNTLDPEAVLVGGGLGLSGGLYWRYMLESARRYIWSDTNRGLPILKAALGTDAPMIGAATRAYEHFGNMT